MCKTDQPPRELMRPHRLNDRVKTDTYFSVYLNIVADTLHSSV